MRAHILVLLASGVMAACNAPSNPDASDAQQSPIAPPSLDVIATGANIAGANGLHFGPDGLLYVVSVIGSDITVIDPDTGNEVKRYTSLDGVFGPDDIAFASDGAFYWTSILTGEVAGFDANGERVVAAQLSPGSNPITFSNDDRLFVSQCFLGTGLYEVDPAGVEPPRSIADDLGPGCGLNGMDWGPDNRLYGPRWFTGEVLSFDVDTGDRRVEASGFSTPAAIKFDSQGVLHVLDTSTGELIRVEESTKTVLATLDPGLDNFAFDDTDRAFISSFTDGYVKRVNADGSLTELQPGGLSHPGGVGVMGDTVWVADASAIRSFDKDSGELLDTQRNIIGVSEIGGSLNLAVNGDFLILSSWFDGDVRVWDPSTQTRIAHYPDLAGPVAAVPYGEGMAISEHFKGTVTLYGAGDPVVLAQGFSAPSGLYVHEGALYVSDRSSGEIALIARDGVALDTPEIAVSGLSAPEGFLVTDKGIVVVEADLARVSKIDADGIQHELAIFPSGSPSAPGMVPSQVFNGIAMDEDGNLFLTGEASRALYRINAPW